VAHFVLTIQHANHRFSGKIDSRKNHAVAKILMDAAHRIQTGHGPIPLRTTTRKSTSLNTPLAKAC